MRNTVATGAVYVCNKQGKDSAKGARSRGFYWYAACRANIAAAAATCFDWLFTVFFVAPDPFFFTNGWSLHVVMIINQLASKQKNSF